MLHSNGLEKYRQQRRARYDRSKTSRTKCYYLIRQKNVSLFYITVVYAAVVRWHCIVFESIIGFEKLKTKYFDNDAQINIVTLVVRRFVTRNVVCTYIHD